jgi:hypothetical protein
LLFPQYSTVRGHRQRPSLSALNNFSFYHIDAYAETAPLPTLPEERHCQWRSLQTTPMPKTLLPMQRQDR